MQPSVSAIMSCMLSSLFLSGNFHFQKQEAEYSSCDTFYMFHPLLGKLLGFFLNFVSLKTSADADLYELLFSPIPFCVILFPRDP